MAGPTQPSKLSVHAISGRTALQVEQAVRSSKFGGTSLAVASLNRDGWTTQKTPQRSGSRA
eukprot:1528478-Pyramimonas_sp.AAC.1